MDARFVDGSGEQLAATISQRADDDDVDGLLVLATESATPETLDSVLQTVSVPVVGGVFPEVLFEGDRYTEGSVVVEFSVAPTTTVVESVSDPETAIGSQLDESLPTPEETTTFVVVDGYASGIERFVEQLFESYGMECTFLGGGAGSLSMEQRPCVITNEGVLEDAGVVATLPVPSTLGVNHGWQEVDGPFRINDADGTTLSMLGEESAFDVYRRVIAEDSGTTLTEENFFEVAKSYPFGISRLHGEKIVRDPFEVDENGSLTCFGEMTEGEYLHVLKGESDDLIDAASTAAETAVEESARSGPVLSFDCISRVLYLEDEFSAELDAIGESSDPAFGALTLGEIANGESGHLQFYNKTVVVAHMAQR